MMNHDEFSALQAFASSPDFYGPQTISLAETSLLTPASPESYKSSREDDRKPAKKRKSWGQELPTPKTNLPPRKRAKTEDEKEQRRIERVLRNRQAAQSSRERKRQEVEKLEGEKYAIERQNYLLKQRLLAVEHEKFALRQKLAQMAAALQKSGSLSRAVSIVPSSPPSPTMTADLLQHDKAIKQELEEYPFALPSPQNTLDPRSSFSSASSSVSRSPSPSRMDFNGAATSPDMTQHPAAMLCGLQCQSGAASRPLRIHVSPRAEARSRPRPPPTPTVIPPTPSTPPLSLTLPSAVYSTLLHPLNQLLTSLKTGSRLKMAFSDPTTMSTLFPLILWLISTPVNPLTSLPPTTTTTMAITSLSPTITTAISSSTSTPTTTTTSTTSTSSPPPSSAPPRSVFRISLLRRLLACSPALARPLKDATGRALQMKTRHALRRDSEGEGCSDDVGGQGVEGISVEAGKAGLVDREARRKEIWRLMTVWFVIDQWGKQRLKTKKEAKRSKALRRSKRTPCTV